MSKESETTIEELEERIDKLEERKMRCVDVMYRDASIQKEHNLFDIIDYGINMEEVEHRMFRDEVRGIFSRTKVDEDDIEFSREEGGSRAVYEVKEGDAKIVEKAVKARNLVEDSLAVSGIDITEDRIVVF